MTLGRSWSERDCGRTNSEKCHPASRSKDEHLEPDWMDTSSMCAGLGITSARPEVCSRGEGLALPRARLGSKKRTIYIGVIYKRDFM